MRQMVCLIFTALLVFSCGNFEYREGSGSDNPDDVIVNEKDINIETTNNDVSGGGGGGGNNEKVPYPPYEFSDPSLEQLYSPLGLSEEDKEYIDGKYAEAGMDFSIDTYIYDGLIHPCHEQENLPLVEFGWTIRVRPYVVTNAKGGWAVSAHRIEKDFEALNEAFKYMALKFEWVEKNKVMLINNPARWTIDGNAEFFQLLNSLPRDKYPGWPVVYVYDTPEGWSGAAYMASNAGVVLTNIPLPNDVATFDKYYDNSAVGAVIVHEFGHQFSLFHTFETEFGVENCDESNCWDAGDLICDTPADPRGCDIKDWDTCELKCDEGTCYHPDPRNLMSYYMILSPDCRRQSFTGRQQAVMACFLKSYCEMMKCNI